MIRGRTGHFLAGAGPHRRRLGPGSPDRLVPAGGEFPHQDDSDWLPLRPLLLRPIESPMLFLEVIAKNLMRRKTRTLLTIAGLAAAVATSTALEQRLVVCLLVARLLRVPRRRRGRLPRRRFRAHHQQLERRAGRPASRAARRGLG